MSKNNHFNLKGMFISKWNNVKQRFYSNLEKQLEETKEQPHKVALGCALGIGINFLPTLGIGFILAFFLATLLRVNRASATAVSLLTGPLVPLLYALNFVSGGLIMAEATGRESIGEFIYTQYALILKVGRFQEQLYGFFELLGSTFILGAVINAFLVGFVFYFFVNYLLNKRIKTLSNPE